MADYRNEYQARICEVIMKKIQGQEIVPIDTGGPDNIIELMEALQRSVKLTNRGFGEKTEVGIAG